jgi:hypothetical protein
MGSNGSSDDKLVITNGRDTINDTGLGDTVVANNLHGGSVINASANDTMLFIGSNSSAAIHLNPVATGDAITVQALTAPDYTGILSISGFGTGDTMDLQGMGFTSFMDVLSHMTFGPIADTLHLNGGGAINFEAPTAFSSHEFLFSTNSGPVHLA